MFRLICTLPVSVFVLLIPWSVILTLTLVCMLMRVMHKHSGRNLLFFFKRQIVAALLKISQAWCWLVCPFLLQNNLWAKPVHHQASHCPGCFRSSVLSNKGGKWECLSTKAFFYTKYVLFFKGPLLSGNVRVLVTIKTLPFRVLLGCKVWAKYWFKKIK